MTSFNKFHQNRKMFLNENKNNDFVLINGSNNILLSAPHGVCQTRLGKIKMQEPGSLATALSLKSRSNCYFIAKTKNNFDDANFDENSNYKKAIENLVLQSKIKYIIDIHGLAKKRDCDINLGTNLGQNVGTNVKLFDFLYKELVSKGFKTEIDNPYMGGYSTVSGSIKKRFPNLWTIQIEINCSITSEKSNINKWNSLVGLLLNFIKKVENVE